MFLLHHSYLPETAILSQHCPHFTQSLNNDRVSEAICQRGNKLKKMIFCFPSPLQTSHPSLLFNDCSPKQHKHTEFMHNHLDPSPLALFSYMCQCGNALSLCCDSPARDRKYGLRSLRKERLIMSHDRRQGCRGIKGLTLKAWRQYEPFSARWPSHNTPLVLFFSSNQLEVLGSHYLRLSCIGFLPRSIILEPFFAVGVWSQTILGQAVKSDCVCVCVFLVFCVWTFSLLLNHQIMNRGCAAQRLTDFTCLSSRSGYFC